VYDGISNELRNQAQGFRYLSTGEKSEVLNANADLIIGLPAGNVVAVYKVLSGFGSMILGLIETSVHGTDFANGQINRRNVLVTLGHVY
jgi:hypothetical protein